MLPQNQEPSKRPAALAGQLALAMELPFVLILSVLMGGGIGYLLDRWLHSEPAMMLIGGLIGAGLGVWDIIRRLSRADKKARSGDDNE